MYKISNKKRRRKINAEVIRFSDGLCGFVLRILLIPTLLYSYVLNCQAWKGTYFLVKSGYIFFMVLGGYLNVSNEFNIDNL